ncbi:probable RNA polymerase II nuclear localization protein SLC7A6OS isoform X1 [Drosophila hydei]|uniref:Probable RNA polymerase II nuclear localization protein SLC7A6OS n=1 Tax=Drosophila hydei TaxID=7224 RepID=A0A6J1LNJ7_DROHY|nr:probable RNA polymerase II nuclear localization protein SLC7A6OS isoform X1 [Drosophila hydei]
MPAVVRIKRRIDEEPHSAFLLNGKRRRLLNDENALAASATAIAENKEEQNQVLLKFAGTLDKQDDCATKQFAAARLNKATAKELVCQTTDPTKASALRREKQRQEQQQLAREQRYRVVNCLRTTLNDLDEESEQEETTGAASGSSSNQDQSKTERRQITIVDIESQQREPEPNVPLQDHQPVDSDIGYVYDLYVPENEMQAQYVDMFDDNYLSLRPVNEVVYEDCYNDDEDYDSEDSNQENYYTNDYPDDDDAGVMGSDDELCQQMNKFMFDDDEDEFASGSSDAEDHNEYHDPYMHTIDAEAASFVDDVDFFNVERQGSAYERYKRRILREAEGLESCSEDSDSDEADAIFESASEQGVESD